MRPGNFWRPFCRLVVTAGLVLVAGVAQSDDQSDDDSAPFSTPPGILLVDVKDFTGTLSVSRPFWTHIADAQGRSLFIYEGDAEPGVSRCTGDCAQKFPPLLAPVGSVAYGDWTLVAREGGVNQWAYKNKPLYRFAAETRISEWVDNLIAERPFRHKEHLYRFVEKEEPLPLPKEWQLAKYEPTAGVPFPTAIKAQDIAAASRLGLVTSEGMTLYSFNGGAEALASACESECARQWRPLAAAELSQTVGEFAPVRRKDGSLQWAYRGAPLYTNRNDLVPGDIKGVQSNDTHDIPAAAGRGWYIPALLRHFTPPEVGVRKDPVRDLIFSTIEGMPLYGRHANQALLKRRDFYQSYYSGKHIGTRGCNAECEQRWRPFQAAAGAQSRGHWEVVEREDGIRQWAYQGFLQYTYLGDKPFGRSTGSFLADNVVGNEGLYKPADVILDYDRNVFHTYYLPSLFWRATSP